MPDIKLGPSGTETTLPDINWNAGGELELPVSTAKHVDIATMLDGSARANYSANHQKEFTLEWELLTGANISTIQGLVDLNQTLHYQNNWVDATWRWVAVVNWEYNAIQSTFASTAKYRASLTLREVTS